MDTSNDNNLKTIEEISEFLKIPVNTLYKYTHRGLIPHYKIRNKLRFDMNEIIDWLETKHIYEKAL